MNKKMICHVSNHYIILLIVSTSHCGLVKDEECLSELLTGLLDVLPIENGIIKPKS